MSRSAARKAALDRRASSFGVVGASSGDLVERLREGGGAGEASGAEDGGERRDV